MKGVVLGMNSKDTDVFKQVVKKLCEVNNISPRKPAFETIDNIVFISMKNHLKDGVDLDCFHILNIIYQIIAPLGMKFNQQLYLYTNSKRVARVTVTFKKEDYDALNTKLKNVNIDN